MATKTTKTVKKAAPKKGAKALPPKFTKGLPPQFSPPGMGA